MRLSFPCIYLGILTTFLRYFTSIARYLCDFWGYTNDKFYVYFDLFIHFKFTHHVYVTAAELEKKACCHYDHTLAWSWWQISLPIHSTLCTRLYASFTFVYLISCYYHYNFVLKVINIAYVLLIIHVKLRHFNFLCSTSFLLHLSVHHLYVDPAKS